jgi:tetratricopeptide (TPR) repeat protein
MGVKSIWQRLLQWLGLATERTALDRAEQLLQQGLIEEAIFACRDILYSTLISLARAARIAMPAGDQDERAYALNDTLSQLGVYAEPLHQQIRQWLRLGELALQGATDEFTLGDVQEMIANLKNLVRVVKVTLEAADLPAPPIYQAQAANGQVPAIGDGGAGQRPAPQMPPRPRTPALTGPGVPLYFEHGQAPVVLGSMPRVPGFVGRGHMVARLTQLLRQGRHVALVPPDAGTAGMGLSALASETIGLLEQDQPPAFPDGILALSCFNRQGEQALRWIYNEIGLTWGVPAIAQAGSLPHQEREVRRVLLGRKTLVVLDGVEMGLPVGRLVDTLASCGATVLITGRHVPRAEQLSVLRLEPLAPAPALTLLQERLNAYGGVQGGDGDEEASRAICATLDHRPLAIELAAAVAVALDLPLPTLSLKLQAAKVRGMLAITTDQNQGLRYLVDLLTQTLDAATVNRFLALAILAGPTWSEEAALAVIGAIETGEDYSGTTNAPPPSESLALLSRRGIIQGIVSPVAGERFRFQSYVRSLAARALLDRPVVMNAAGRAMAAHYAGLALRLRRSKDRDLMREEYLHMEAGLQWAHQHNEPELEVSYGMGLFRFWQKEGLWHEGARFLNWSIRAAREIGDRPREATLAQELATLQANIGYRSRARETFEHSLKVWQGLGNSRNAATVLFELGRLAQEDNQSENARVYYDGSLQAAREADDEQAMARALQAMGLIFETNGQIEDARRCYEKVFEMRQNAHDPVGMAGALEVLGVLEFRQGRYAAAYDLLTASLNNAIDAGNLFWEAEARFWLGETLVAMRNPHDAANQWQRALALYIRQGRAADVEETQRRLARLMGT